MTAPTLPIPDPAFTITLEYQPKPWNTNNERRDSWPETRGFVKEWKQSARTAAVKWRNQNRPTLPLPPSLIHVTIPVSTRHKRDPHNYCGTVVKAVIDGLVAAGLWPDDTPEFVAHLEPTLVYDADARILAGGVWQPGRERTIISIIH